MTTITDTATTMKKERRYTGKRWQGCLRALLALCVPLLATGCEHKDLCYDHSHYAAVDVVFDWQLAPDADPAYMEAYFFPADGGEIQRFGFGDRAGGQIELLPGTYSVLCLNTGTPTNLVRNTGQWSRFEVYTRNASVLEGLGSLMAAVATEPPRPEGAEGQSGALEPDLLWTARLDLVTVELTAEPQTVTLTPEQSVSRFTVKILHADNLDYASGLSGSLSGLSRGLYVGLNELDPECVTVPFAVQTADDASLSAAFRGFGHCPDGDNGIPHKLVVYAMLDDGSKWYYTFDVTDQVHRAPDQRNVYIELDELPLPEPITDGGGIQPGIDDWEDVQVDIPM